MRVFKTKEELRQALRALRRQGKRLAFVPTMGGLHDGHRTLMREARGFEDVVVASIFVNPLQFDDPEDLANYPRRLEVDLALLEQEQVDIIYTPDESEMYPEGFSTRVHVRKYGEGLCANHRPGHFDGMATVVLKLLMQVMPNIAVFGEKDWQQLMIVRRMVQDVDIPVDIIGVRTIRDKSGLALSSRNGRLTEEQRQRASWLYKSLVEAGERLQEGRQSTTEILRWVEERLLEHGFDKVDYVELRDAQTFEPLPKLNDAGRLLAAAHINGVRLIDNIRIVK